MPRDNAAVADKRKPSTKQEFNKGDRVTYTSMTDDEKTVEILCYVPASTKLKEHIDKLNLPKDQLADLNKDVNLDSGGPKYLVREPTNGKKRARYYSPSAGTVNKGKRVAA